MNDLPAPLAGHLHRQLERLHAAAPQALADRMRQPESMRQIERLLIASDYALDRLCVDPELVTTLDAPCADLELPPNEATSWASRLRRHRHAESVRLIHRDVNGIDAIDDTLIGTSRLAEQCLVAALATVEGTMRARHGVPRNDAGQAQRLVVFALGKLGGSELNFSSDIDLVFAFPESGQSDGARALDNGDWFQRAGQQLIQLLSEVIAEGMAYRVDMRLRPFGQSGRLAQSFAAMEHYFQREGRDWERYAWIKARPVAGDIAAGERFLATLRPFVYRRYLDFGAFEGLREMKALIEAEVQRRDLEGHLKLGRGGIREIEFIVQLQQMIRGGREPALRERGLLPALDRLREGGYVPESSAAALGAAYRFLRRLENRLQMLREEQTHSLPEGELDRARIACGLGFAEWGALDAALERHRAAVREEFARVFEARDQSPRAATPDAVAALGLVWVDPEDAHAPQRLAQAGFTQATDLAQRLAAFRRLPALASMSARAAGRLERLMPHLLAAAAHSVAPDAAAMRALELVQAVLRRSSYLALLDEEPAALARVVDVMARSRWMAERLCAHPLLLDELLDARADAAPPTRAEVEAAVDRAVAPHAGDDIEARLTALNEFRQSCAFRVARARLVDRQDAPSSARQLAFIAQAVLRAVLPMALDDLARQHGRLPAGGVAAIAYGSFGGCELGLGSDLDLVFLYDDAHDADQTDGARPLEAVRYHTRVVQKVIALLGLVTSAGRLYETDLRLRPDGTKGLLVSSLQSFAAYQRERAWTWEQQALVRARAVAGDESVQAAFERIRAEVLCLPRARAAVSRDARAMRQRMRAELDRSREGLFDLKQGHGGLVDLEFLVQAAVLIAAAEAPGVTASTRTPELIDALAGCGFFSTRSAQALRRAHGVLLARALACTLDGRARLAAPDAALEDARAAIKAAWQNYLAKPLPDATG
jgi:glutamate-ammonia-ligase adenylyltransferase